MCCNSEDACQEIKLKKNVWERSAIQMIFLVLGFICITYIIVFIISAIPNGQSNLEDIYTDTSVHSFIFTEGIGIVPKIIYVLSMCLQFALFAVFMQASDINNEQTDWKFTFKCPDNRIDCIDLKKANGLGWVMFTIVILCIIGPDIIMSMKQLYQGFLIQDRKKVELLVSGFMLLVLTIFAMYASYNYNRALAQRNTDLIMNAVVLTFIVQLDDQIYIILKKLRPKWIETVREHIENRMK